MEESIHKKLVSKLKNHKLTLEALAGEMKSSQRQARHWIKELREQSVIVNGKTNRLTGNIEYYINMYPENGNIYYICGPDNERTTMKFAASSDMHWGSMFHLPNTFRETMERVRDEGIKRVYIAGDLCDGEKVYKGHSQNLIRSGVECQTDLAAEALSEFSDLEFWGIAGNHDYSFTQQNGIRPLAVLESKIDNFKNLGDFRADVVYHGIKIRLLHGASGKAYAISYPSQTYLRDYFRGMEFEDMQSMPHVIILGHFHTFYNGKDHGIHIVQPGSFQDGDNEFCIRRGLTGPNGCALIEAVCKASRIEEFDCRYIQPSIAQQEKGSTFCKKSISYERRR